MLDTALFPMTYGVQQMNSSVEFQRWLKREMYDRGWKQIKLAKESGLSQGAISHLLRGTRAPGQDTCLKLALAFEMPFGDVLAVAGFPVATSGETEPTKLKLGRIIDDLTPEGRDLLIDLAMFVMERHRRE